MRVLGIDPGSTNTGYGILDETGSGLQLIACGVIRAGRGPLAPRLGRILAGVDELLSEYRPDSMAVEEVFFARNVKSALVLSQARGAAMAAAGRSQVTVFEYSARRVKQTVAGHGGANKKQLQAILQATLGEVPEQTDASDALAIALCHLRWVNEPGKEDRS